MVTCGIDLFHPNLDTTPDLCSNLIWDIMTLLTKCRAIVLILHRERLCPLSQIV